MLTNEKKQRVIKKDTMKTKNKHFFVSVPPLPPALILFIFQYFKCARFLRLFKMGRIHFLFYLMCSVFLWVEDPTTGGNTFFFVSTITRKNVSLCVFFLVFN